MGEDAFFVAMRSWVADHQHGFVGARELLRHWQASTDADLEPIYRGYLANLDATLNKPLSGLRRLPGG
jgi:hypothetical protein